MNKKILVLATVTAFLSIASYGQEVKETIDKAVKNPATKENAAKADVRLIDKKIITDSSVLKNPQQASAVNKKRKKHCKRRG